jgi:hypothetical protein
VVTADLMADVNIDTNDLAGASAAGVDVRIWKNPFSCCTAASITTLWGKT